MKIKLDENLPARLIPILTRMGHQVDTVLLESMGGRDDEDVWKAAQLTKRFLITQDLDFSDIRQYQPGTHEGVLVLRLREPGREAILHRVENLFLSEEVERWTRCFVVASEAKVRVRRPPP